MVIGESVERPEVEFLSYFRSSRLLKVGFAFNMLYYIIVVLVFVMLNWNGQLSTTVYSYDWIVFYEAGHMFQISPGEIYTVNPNGLPYRYFPAFAMFMSLLQWMPLEIAYILNVSLMMIVNWAILWTAFHVCLSSGLATHTKNFEKTLLFVYIAPQHIVNIILGQISQIVILLVLSAALLLQKSQEVTFKKYLLVGLLIGLASNLKPFILLFIPFLVPVYRSSRLSFKVSIHSILGVTLGVLVALVPNLIYFAFFPEAIGEFIQLNFVDTLDYHHSTSITRLLSALIPIFQEPILKSVAMIVIGGSLLVISYRRFIVTENSEKKYVQYFAEMAFLLLLVYPDSWFLFLAIWYTLLGPSILILYKENISQSREEKLIDTLWSGANNLLAFFTIGVVLHYLVLGFDPVIPLWLVVLYILYQKLLN
ncbi:MAG: glycosyltransferase 87 family protein [Candidatus Thorarchaeota archaeon SMTZ1-45]